MSPAKKKLNIALWFMRGIAYLGAMFAGSGTLILLTMNLSGPMQLALAVVTVVCIHLTYRDLVTRYKVFVVSSAIETVLVSTINNAVDIERASHREKGKYVPKPIKYGAIDVSDECAARLYRQWFWKAPKHFQFLNGCFSWSINPFAMIRQALPVTDVEPRTDRFNLNVVEFQLSPTANNQDLLGMGWEVFRTITEFALSANIPRRDWRIRYVANRGIELHHKEQRNE